MVMLPLLQKKDVVDAWDTVCPSSRDHVRLWDRNCIYAGYCARPPFRNW